MFKRVETVVPRSPSVNPSGKECLSGERVSDLRPTSVPSLLDDLGKTRDTKKVTLCQGDLGLPSSLTLRFDPLTGAHVTSPNGVRDVARAYDVLATVDVDAALEGSRLRVRRLKLSPLVLQEE